MVLRFAALAASALALTACTTGPGMGDGAQPQGFEDYEGDPRLGERVDRICFGSQIDNFRDTTRDTVLLEAGLNDWYLVHTFTCPDLDFAQSLSFDRYGSCLRQNDALIAYDSVTGPDRSEPTPQRCQIRAIYDWNPDALTEAAAD
ncbi:MAG: DUF6491 family protein [Oceanicaulis sp.]